MFRFSVWIAILGAISGNWVFAQEVSDATIGLINSSIVLEQKNDFAAALDKMRLAAEANPDNYVVQLRLGWTEYLNANYHRSEAAYKNASLLSGERCIEALLGRTYPLSALKEWERLEETYLKILSVDSDQFEANLYLGQLLANRGDNARALPYLEKAHYLFPSNYNVNLTLGWAYVSAGNNAAAHVCFQNALMLSPADSSASRGIVLTR
jgi:tetratricopeptide (TPR) repeat protein